MARGCRLGTLLALAPALAASPGLAQEPPIDFRTDESSCIIATATRDKLFADEATARCRTRHGWNDEQTEAASRLARVSSELVRSFGTFQKEGLDHHALLAIFQSLTPQQKVLLGTPEAHLSEARSALYRILAERMVKLGLTVAQGGAAGELLHIIAEVERARTLFLEAKAKP